MDSRSQNSGGRPLHENRSSSRRVLSVFLVFFMATLCSTTIQAGEEDPPSSPHTRIIEMPIDHTDPEAGTFSYFYELSSNFDFGRPTIFFFQDTQQNYGTPGKVER